MSTQDSTDNVAVPIIIRSYTPFLTSHLKFAMSLTRQHLNCEITNTGADGLNLNCSKVAPGQHNRKYKHMNACPIEAD